MKRIQGRWILVPALAAGLLVAISAYLSGDSSHHGSSQNTWSAVSPSTKRPQAGQAAKPAGNKAALRGNDDEIPTEDSGIYEREEYLTGPPPALQLFANGGRVPTGAAETAGLTEAERDEVERAARAMWKQLSTLFGEALAVDKESSSPDLITLKAKAFPDAAKAAIAELESRIDAATGPGKAEILKSIAYPPSSFGHAGRNDVLIEYTPSKKSYYWEYRDPATGKTVVSGTSEIDGFSGQFGNQIDLSQIAREHRQP